MNLSNNVCRAATGMGGSHGCEINMPMRTCCNFFGGNPVNHVEKLTSCGLIDVQSATICSTINLVA